LSDIDDDNDDNDYDKRVNDYFYSKKIRHTIKSNLLEIINELKIIQKTLIND